MFNEPISQLKHIGFQECSQCKDAHQISIASQVATKELTGGPSDVCETRKEEVQDRHLLGQCLLDKRKAEVAEKRHDEQGRE